MMGDYFNPTEKLIFSFAYVGHIEATGLRLFNNQLKCPGRIFN